MNINHMADMVMVQSDEWFPGLYDEQAGALVHATLGLAGEAGEVANVVKKANRDGSITDLSDEQRIRIGEEATDVLIYTLMIMKTLGLNPTDLFLDNRRNCLERFGSSRSAEMMVGKYPSKVGNDTVPISIDPNFGV